MKKFSPAFWIFLACTFSILLFTACSKINEATIVGDDLIPAVDNVTTFEKLLTVETDNRLLTDSTRLAYNDEVAIGHFNDPEFGQTHGDVYFTIGRSTYGSYPFINRDSVIIDSVVLSLAYRGNYGDSNSQLSVRVFEIAPQSTFTADSSYLFTHEDFATGPELGNRSFSVNQLNDSMTLIRARDTSRVANVLRIPLQNELGQRFAGFDTANNANGGFRNDSIFRSLFKGLAVKAEQSGNTLAYFSLADQSNTKLTVYFRATKNGRIDTTSTDFVHSNRGQANLIRREAGGNFLAYLNNGTASDDKLYIQTPPQGSYGFLRVPALDTFTNKIVHRAELVLVRVPSMQDHLFTPPARLVLDKYDPAIDTTAFLLQNDLVVTQSGLDYNRFGGQLRIDNTYRFSITRHVQSVITGLERNRPLRLYAPLEALQFSTLAGAYVPVSAISQIANGRVVLAGGNHADPALQLRLRIIYSNL